MKITTKICSSCSFEKELDLFVKNSNQCKKCKAIVNKKWRIDNKEEISKKKKKNYIKNKKKILKRQKKFYNNNKTKVCAGSKKYRDNNKDKTVAYSAKYYDENKEKIIAKNIEYERKRMKTDPIYKLRKYLSKAIGLALKATGGSKAGESVMKYIPFSIKEMKDHLESQFEPWMTWENRGTYKKASYKEDDTSTWTWHIDHIIPQSKLPFSSLKDKNMKKCWSLKNLQPLKSIDNIKKGSK